MTSPTVFISYAREDRLHAATIAAALKDAEMDVWWDERLRVGDEFSAEIEARLRSADCVVVMWTQASVTSTWVKAEATIAAERGVLVPITSHGATPPLPFNSFQTLDITEWLNGSAAAPAKTLIESIVNRTGRLHLVSQKAQRNRVDELRTFLLAAPSSRDIYAGFNELEAYVKSHADDRDAWRLLEQYRQAVRVLRENERPEFAAPAPRAASRRDSVVGFAVIGSLLLLIGFIGWSVFRFGAGPSLLVGAGVVLAGLAGMLIAVLARGWIADRRTRQRKGR